MLNRHKALSSYREMGRNPALPLLWLLSLAVVAIVTGDGSNPRPAGASTGATAATAATCHRSSRAVSLSSYCESWRANVELNNIRAFGAVPSECSDHVGKYMTSPQYDSDVQRATDEAANFLTSKFVAGGDEKDAWVFDVDDTLLSTLPYFKKHHYGAVLWCGGEDNPSRSSLTQWLEAGEAPALLQVLDLFVKIKDKGLKIFFISSRSEAMREATVNNLVQAGYSGWAELILRCDESYSDVQAYKAAQRKKLVDQGFRIWGILGDQWSSILGEPSAKRTFKLPNPMYYEA